MSISLESVEKINALKQGIEAVTGETYNDLTTGIQALKDNYATDEQIQAVNSWDLIKTYFENYIGFGHALFSASPSNADGASYKLPYIYTPKIRWGTNANGAFSTKLLEAGVDVTSASEGSLSGQHFSASGMQRLTLTGNANASSLRYFMYRASSLAYIKMETPNVEKLRENSSYYVNAFAWCGELITVDCELDFTNQTNITDIFRACSKLEDLRIKPFTLSTSLNLGGSRSLHHNTLGDYDSIISILNGITNDKTVASTMTITFSNNIKDNQNANEYWNKTVYLDSGDGIYYSEQAEGRTEYSLYNAFLNKGVTIAWM